MVPQAKNPGAGEARAQMEMAKVGEAEVGLMVDLDLKVHPLTP